MNDTPVTPGDVTRVEHLALDAGAIIDVINIQNLAKFYYAPQDVMNELRDKKTRRKIDFIPFDIVVREPSTEAFKQVAEAAKKTGDFRVLSIADMKVIALTLDLHNHFVKGESVVPGESAEKQTDQKDGEDAMEETSIPEEEEHEDDPEDAEPKNMHIPDGFCVDEVDSDDDEGWITEANVEGANGMNVEVDETPTVACFTTDYAVQNVLLTMHLKLVSLKGRLIKRIQSYIQRCRSCYSTCTDNTREFCPKCGNKSMHKCAVSVDESGNQTVHVNWRRQAVTRGLRSSKAAPAGGKHHLPEKIFEDQRMPHLQPSRARSDKAWDETFAVHDVTSRASALGVRTLQNQSRRVGNVNARGPPGKRRGGKR